MKHLLLSALLGVGVVNANNGAAYSNMPLTGNSLNISSQVGSDGSTRMRAIEFKAQEFCRVELPDFFYDVHYSLVSATVYFSGANFKGIEKGTISSTRLAPIKKLMDRCIPGSVVTFDDVRVVGPDKEVRTIDGLTLVLY
ncbi:hypothetical protein [Ferruginibacter albus]|uniref:hypothetical protein n=1 Tax=Ferruginibacter albus TaxID=2875540 RepID=UPI001CC3C44B|nr:hypothetical protein [Ferruginibacter albus]UAY50872.1 hypothetical protein K9M53_09745 [Ferruginibacter albus]